SKSEPHWRLNCTKSARQSARVQHWADAEFGVLLGLAKEMQQMKRAKSVRFGNIAVAAVMGLLLTLSVQAEIKSHSGNQIVEEPADLPEMARTPGQSLFLYQAADGETYLYVEQQNGARLAIFDVTDPAKIKAAASVPVKGPGTFDFVRYLNDLTELV